MEKNKGFIYLVTLFLKNFNFNFIKIDQVDLNEWFCKIWPDLFISPFIFYNLNSNYLIFYFIKNNWNIVILSYLKHFKFYFLIKSIFLKQYFSQRFILINIFFKDKFFKPYSTVACMVALLIILMTILALFEPVPMDFWPI